MIDNHFTATGIVFNSKNEILMIHHNKFQVWLPPGGHVEENELPADAVIREIIEETGVDAIIIPNNKGLELTSEYCKELELPFAMFMEDINSDGTHNHIDMYFLCRAITTDITPLACPPPLTLVTGGGSDFHNKW